jgi:hypothetical protein
MANEVQVMQDLQAPAPQQGYGGILQHQTSLEDTRTLQEIKAKIQLARMFPRRIQLHEINAEIEGNCSRFDFAKSAIYSLPRGGERVEGLSIKDLMWCAVTITKARLFATHGIWNATPVGAAKSLLNMRERQGEALRKSPILMKCASM